MIRIDSFSKSKQKTPAAENKGYGNNVTIINQNNGKAELKPHYLWGQLFDDNDVDGDMTVKGNVTGNNAYFSNISGNTAEFTQSVSADTFNGNKVIATDITSEIVKTKTVNADKGDITSIESKSINNTGNINTKKLSSENINNTDTITTKNLNVTGSARFWELTIEKLKAAGGAVLYTPADGFKCDMVQPIEGGYRLLWRVDDGDGNQRDNMWRKNDQALCLTFNKAKVGVNRNVSNKYYWTLVTNTSESTKPVKINNIKYHYIEVSSTIVDGQLNPEQGDTIAMLGYRGQDDEARQSAIYISAYHSLDNGYIDKNTGKVIEGLKAPLFATYQGISDFNLSSHRKTYIDSNGSKWVGDIEINTGQSLEDYLNEVLNNTEVKTYQYKAYAKTPNGDGFTIEDKSNDDAYRYVGIYVSTSKTQPTDPKLYNWIEKGKQGEKGNDGVGISSIIEEYYLSDSNINLTGGTWTTQPPTGAKGKWLWTRSIIHYTNGTSESKGQICVGYMGKDGADGTGIDIKSSQNDCVEIGDAYIDKDGNLQIVTSLSPKTFTNGGKIKGKDGKNGNDGKTYYLHTAWCNTSDNSDSSFTTENPNGKSFKYIGTKSDTLSADTKVFNYYDWVCIKGKDGDNGTSVKISSTSVSYALSDNATTPPTNNWQNTPQQATNEKPYLWTKTEVKYNDGISTISYSVSHKGKDGDNGKSISIITATTKYCVTASNIQPDDEQFVYDSIKAANPNIGEFVWSMSIVTYSDNNTIKQYSVSRIGSDGEKGDKGSDGLTTHFAYAKGGIVTTATTKGNVTTNANWKFSVTNFSDSELIGTYTDDKANDSTNYKDYFWSQLKGKKGDKGDTGNGIIAVDVEYTLSQSRTTTPTSGWNTNPPKPQKGYYIWSRTKITYSNNQIKYTNPVCLSGEDGVGKDAEFDTIDWNVCYGVVDKDDNLLIKVLLNLKHYKGDKIVNKDFSSYLVETYPSYDYSLDYDWTKAVNADGSFEFKKVIPNYSKITNKPTMIWVDVKNESGLLQKKIVPITLQPSVYQKINQQLGTYELRIQSSETKITDANNKIDQANNKITDANNKIDQANNKIDQANNKINNVETTVKSNTASINANSKQIALKAEQSTVNTLGDKLKSTEKTVGEIKVKNDEISSEVKSAKTVLDGNLIYDSYIDEWSNAYGFAIRNVMPLVNGQTYTLTIRGKIDAKAKADGKTLAVYIYNKDWKYFNREIHIDSTELTTKSITFKYYTKEPLDVFVSAYLHPYQGSREGKVYLEWVMLREGSEEKEYTERMYGVTENTSSLIHQTADNIELKVKNDFKETGIDITDGRIKLDADNTVINGNLKITNPSEGLIIYDADNNARVKITNENIDVNDTGKIKNQIFGSSISTAYQTNVIAANEGYYSYVYNVNCYTKADSLIKTEFKMGKFPKNQTINLTVPTFETTLYGINNDVKPNSGKLVDSGNTNNNGNTLYDDTPFSGETLVGTQDLNLTKNLKAIIKYYINDKEIVSARTNASITYTERTIYTGSTFNRRIDGGSQVDGTVKGVYKINLKGVARTINTTEQGLGKIVIELIVPSSSLTTLYNCQTKITNGLKQLYFNTKVECEYESWNNAGAIIASLTKIGTNGLMIALNKDKKLTVADNKIMVESNGSIIKFEKDGILQQVEQKSGALVWMPYGYKRKIKVINDVKSYVIQNEKDYMFDTFFINQPNTGSDIAIYLPIDPYDGQCVTIMSVTGNRIVCVYPNDKFRSVGIWGMKSKNDYFTMPNHSATKWVYCQEAQLWFGGFDFANP